MFVSMCSPQLTRLSLHEMIGYSQCYQFWCSIWKKRLWRAAQSCHFWSQHIQNPDLRPWLVRKSAYASGEGEASDSRKNYYEYLSTLLHSMYGDQTARQDKELLREWCCLSVESDAPDYRANFYSVAHGNNKAYNRDLPMLLDLSMKIKDNELSLSLGKSSLFVFYNARALKNSVRHCPLN